MALAITSAPTTELLTVEEAKRHLRIYSSDLDDEIASLISAARDYCERYTQRTLRSTTTRTLKLDVWWDTEQRLPWPPLIAVSSIAYYDADEASQTLAASNYEVVIGTDGAGLVKWAWDAVLPALFDREDAVTVTYTTGYTTIDPTSANPLPPVALMAMKTKLTELYGAGTESEIAAARACTDRLLSLVDWTGYA